MFVNTWRLARFAVRCYTHPPFLELLAWQKCRSGWRRLLLLLLLLLLRAHAQSRGDLLALPSLADCACWKVAAMFNFFAARLCMLACEIKGRWKDESLRLIASSSVSETCEPVLLRGAGNQGWFRRWWGLLSIAVQPRTQAPPLQNIFHDACPPVPSCWPAR